MLGLSSADLKDEVSLVNVFASWCVECRAEHPLLLRMREARRPADPWPQLQGCSRRRGKVARTRSAIPYTRTGADLNGRVAIDWGVYGVPETFVITKSGHHRLQADRRITKEALANTILPGRAPAPGQFRAGEHETRSRCSSSSFRAAGMKFLRNGGHRGDGEPRFARYAPTAARNHHRRWRRQGRRALRFSRQVRLAEYLGDLVPPVPKGNADA